MRNLVLDGFKNLITKLGVRGKDRVTANQIAPAYIITYPELTAFYMGDGLGKRVIDMPANDATRAGWDILGDPEQCLQREMNRLSVAQVYNEAMRWYRLYGGALTVINWDDGRPLDQPFRQRDSSPYKIISMRTYASSRIWLMATDFDADPQSERFERPTMFTIRRMYGAPFKVHWTRCQEWLGSSAPDPTYPGLDLYRRYWGFGVVQSCVQELSNLGLSWNAVANLFQEATIGKLKMSNLETLLAEDDEDAIVKRMEGIGLSKSVINMVMLGADEEYTRDSLSFEGVAAVIDRMLMMVSSTVNIPVSLLFGRGAAGMNATGEGDARQYYDGISSEQIQTLQPKILQLASWMHPYIAPEVQLDELSVRFVPVWSPSQQELVQMHLQQAQADHIYMEDQVLTPQIVLQNRFEGGYSFETSVAVNAKAAASSQEPPDVA
jgi:phage-related protein (TIGR01555 family)